MLKYITTFLYIISITSSFAQYQGGEGGGAHFGETVASVSFDLPITLSSFTLAGNHDGSVTLKWETSTEINNAYFEVQKSIDGRHWNTITEIEGAGNSAVKLAYTYTDNSPNIGKTYYRLHQIDFDKNESYSSVLVYQNGEVETVLSLFTYPNPFVSSFTVTGDEVELSTLKVFDANGREIILSQKIENTNTVTISLVEFPKGMYFIKTRKLSKCVIKK
ncbi:T9SS type A sorting domain-containing protein [Flammeovirga pectinis]|nr:T9SS type A sorting domain-containing protein [Flammeovirga pectinis]